MPRQRSLLNVRDYVTEVVAAIDGYNKYGSCPIVDHEFTQLKLIGKAILRANDAKRAKGNRKDIYIGGDNA